ncbi:dihydrofolate reductase [Asticcacaulis sp. AC402]|uniref:dihydrofolate reductase n=1 Tax=Asticcacaulis sp. AC402 TaxID=1282361 RepID=UPI0003C3F289|nr:dihydrofolate reductase [Asticcacaulis sp. AC402]ESQ74099.1 diacylglycerol kinase [Asticcacaulis sp. AC402]
MSSKVPLAVVVAMDENNAIGKAGGLPWRLRSDMKLFKDITLGKPILMGSNTWDSLPKKPLPGRLNLVLSRDLKFEAEGGVVCETLFEALDIGREHAADDGAGEVCVIGGANVYAQTLPRADRLYVTHVHATVDGDTHFPAIDPAIWRVVREEAFAKTENDDFDFTLKVYERGK